MKDITIKGTRIKKEIIFWFVSFVIASAVNIIGIIKYNTSWWELITQLHVVIAVSILIYMLIGIVRGLIYFVLKISNKQK